MKAKKSLGQNFLVDKRVAGRILSVVSPSRNELILEVGPGHGALTELLAERAGFVLAVELDHELFEKLCKELPLYNLKLVENDILNVDIEALITDVVSKWNLAHPGNPIETVRVVANLPYNISTAVVSKFIRARPLIKDLTLMLQREVAERIASPPGGKEYGILSVISQLYAKTKIVFNVAPGSFRPVPKVESSVIQLEFYDSSTVAEHNEDLLAKVVRSAFSQRRKTIHNSLRATVAEIDPKLKSDEVYTIIEAAGIEHVRRAETLSSAEFVKLSNTFLRFIQQVTS
ncbi:MAG: ribosomal RNA small subunit methyltransferase A [Blastocatellia bacterium]|nr:ribosomal RNA small subunit methyltransferase A [Blastocatellia bacterium]